MSTLYYIIMFKVMSLHITVSLGMVAKDNKKDGYFSKWNVDKNNTFIWLYEYKHNILITKKIFTKQMQSSAISTELWLLVAKWPITIATIPNLS